jgi:hypothetical protein
LFSFIYDRRHLRLHDTNHGMPLKCFRPERYNQKK